VAESDDLVPCQIAADHPFRHARLQRLIKDRSAAGEIQLTPAHERAERDLLDDAAALGMKDMDRRARPRNARTACRRSTTAMGRTKPRLPTPGAGLAKT
jgi:hypothetical protein